MNRRTWIGKDLGFGRLVGKVKAWSDDRGWGHISSDSPLLKGSDVFCNRSVLVGVLNLHVGDIVSFHVHDIGRGPQALYTQVITPANPVMSILISTPNAPALETAMDELASQTTITDPTPEGLDALASSLTEASLVNVPQLVVSAKRPVVKQGLLKRLKVMAAKRFPDRTAAGQASGEPAAKKAKVEKTNPGIPTRVLMLTNMVGAGEVDEDLEEETADEAKKYGKLLDCKIRERQGVHDSEAVRIFLQFEEIASAKKACEDFNGRFFDGRTVRARYYSEELYGKKELEA
eukprot:TRINITY_DN8150_c0_g1_i1.p1 TRINITY_DN8150_c0_g1~~TRINITY_DN8150_c0_g1_i1.p1  ORF type:complete len:290 (+),score=60.39 TRINITY_DN8150_c0_g1_i1:121-990(+)